MPSPSLDGRTAPASSRLSRRVRLGLAVLAGAMAALGHAPWDLWPLTILGLAAAFWLSLAEERPMRVALIWWLAGCGYFGLALSWIVEPFLVDIQTHGWMAPFALVFMAAGMALFWGGAGALARWIAPYGRGRFALAMALSLATTGVIRGVIFTGFPWALPGHVLIATPMLQLAQLGGAIGLGLIVLGLAFGLVVALNRPLPRLIVWAVALAGLWGAGMALMAPQTDTAGRPVVRLVQPNVPQDEKWNPMLSQQHFDRLLDLTAQPGDYDLVVWPETAVPAWLDQVPQLMPVISDAAGGQPVVFGINRGDDQRIYNSLVLLGTDGQIAETYDKHHLVPFGEYIPLGDLLGQIGIRGMAQREGNGFSPGPGARLLDVPGLGSTLPLICYEGIFPRDIFAAPARPSALLLITNDAWFGTVSGPYQHLAQARLRSVEQGLPMIRVANTGISAVIDPAGRVSGEMALGAQGFRDVALPSAAPATLYARIGDTPIFVALIVAMAVLITRKRKKPSDIGVDGASGGV